MNSVRIVVLSDNCASARAASEWAGVGPSNTTHTFGYCLLQPGRAHWPLGTGGGAVARRSARAGQL